jgi:hypothetical protein
MRCYDGWCRRIDFNLRARYPYLTTRIFKMLDYSYNIYIESEIDDFSNLSKIFNYEIKYITAPVKIVEKLPEDYEVELFCILDENIPSNFEGFPFTFNQMFDVNNLQRVKNPTLEMISTFDTNDFISVLDFEHEISSSVIRNGMNSLFSELNSLNGIERNDRVLQYNENVEYQLRNNNITKCFLDLSEDALGVIIPFLSTLKKVVRGSVTRAEKCIPVIKEVSEYIEDKTLNKNIEKRHVSILSKVNRVAKLRSEYK